MAVMNHPDVEAIATIAHYSVASATKPHIFAQMMNLYDGSPPPSSTQIISSSCLSKHNDEIGQGTLCMSIQIQLCLI